MNTHTAGLPDSRRMRPIERVLVLAALIGLFCVLFGSTFQARFGLVEEHRIVVDSQRSWRWWLATMTTEDILVFGRVRPVYFLVHYGNILLFGPHAHILHLVTTGLGIVTCFLLYVAARRIGADVGSALVFIVLVVVTGDHGEIWYRLFSPAEAFGMPLAAVAIWALVTAASKTASRFWDAVALIAMALAGLAKESFILTIPALLLLRWLLHCWFRGNSWRSALGGLGRFMLIGALLFTVELLVVALVSLTRPSTYGANIAGLSPGSFDPRTWYSLLISPGLARRTVFLLIGVVVLLIHGAWPSHRASRTYLVGAGAVVLAWLVPQLVLYRHGIAEHYLFPAIVAPAAFAGLTLAVLWHTRRWFTRIVWVAAVLSLAPLIASDAAATSEAASRYTAETLALHRMVSYLAEKVTEGRAILTAADPATTYGFEALAAVHAYVAFAGSASPVYLWPVLDPGRHSSLHAAVAEGIVSAFGYPKTLHAQDVGAIVVASNPGAGALPSWFVDAQWREVIFREPYYALVPQRLRYRRAGAVTLRILVPGEEVPGALLESPLVIVGPSLHGRVGINPLLRTPSWGVEQHEGGSLLWLGDGADASMTVMLWSVGQQAVRVVCDVHAGPARSDSRRTVELTFRSGTMTTTAQQAFDGSAALSFPGILYPGRNELTLTVLDKVSLDRPAGADPRPLLVQLRRLMVAPSPDAADHSDSTVTSR